MVLVFHITSAIVLTYLVGFFGKASRKLGYVNISDIFDNDSLGFNLSFRILTPALFISFLSVILYKINLNYFVVNIWFIVIWYIVGNFIILLVFNRWQFVDKLVYFFVLFVTILVAYWFYATSLSKGLDYILPESGNFRTEIWFILIFYIFNLLQNINPNYEKLEQSKKNLLQSKLNYFYKKYRKLLLQEFKENVVLNRLFFSIMIYEDMSRPKIIRFFEKILFPFAVIKTSGIMQIKNKTFLTDEESVVLAQNKILNYYNEYKSHEEYKLVQILASKYNDEMYAGNIINIYFQIKDSKLEN